MDGYRSLAVWILSLLGVLSLAQSVQANEVHQEALTEAQAESLAPAAERQPADLDAATTVAEWEIRLAQSLVQITKVQVESTEAGLRIILETAGELPVPATRTVGNALIADIPNARLSEELQQTNPAAGIALVSVTSLPENRVRVAITGTDAPPTAQIRTDPSGLAFSVITGTAAAAGQDEEAIEITVTGEEEGYAVSRSTVGTRTDAELRDVPQSIQVIPRQVIEDQGANNIGDVLGNVSGVSEQGGRFFIRGFESTDSFLRDGVGTSSSFRRTDLDLSNVEQVEVLKGPASVLYGSGEPGGTVNLVTEQPLRDPAYEIEGTIGSYDFYRGTIDLTGPLNDDRTILYRLNAAYENAGSFVDFLNRESIAVFPVLSFQLGANTLLTVEGGYEYEEGGNFSDPGLPLEGTILPNPVGEIPRNRFLGEPDLDRDTLSEGYVGYRLDHDFSDDWSIRNQFVASFSTLTLDGGVFFLGLDEDNRTLGREFGTGIFENQNYTLQTSVTGEFQTGIIDHSLLFGIDFSRNHFSEEQNATIGLSFDIDVFDPEYGDRASPDDFSSPSALESTAHTIGVYAQDLLSIGEQVKMLLGGRLDWFFNDSTQSSGESEYTEAFAFSPRVGIVYQPIEPVSLYASYSRSFAPEFGADREGNPFEPTRGNQFEVGVRTELLNRRLIATLAAYYITRQNELVPDPDDSNFSVQLGSTRSQGIEFDIAGEPLPGLRLIANYAYTDAIITEGESAFEGNRISGIPLHSGSLWTVYELQAGVLAGLGFGAGVRVVGDAEGDFENTYLLPSYVRTDALLYYRRDNWRVQVNVENLFDTEYFEASNRRYGQPFIIRGTVSMTF